MESTKYSRKIDSLGRLVIPSKLRAELNIQPGDLFEFFTQEIDNKIYLCIPCDNAKTDLDKAKAIIEAAGYTLAK